MVPENTKALYRAAIGSHLTDKDAEIIGQYLTELANDRAMGVNGLTPEDILDAARPDDSPIHKYFEWDDTEAAHKYRLEQAKYIARSWTITFVPVAMQQPFIGRGMVSIRPNPAKKDRVYIAVTEALESPKYLQQLADEARRRMKFWYDTFKQYEQIQEFAQFGGIFSAIKDWEDDQDEESAG